MRPKEFLKPCKTKLITLFLLVLPLAFITYGIVFIIGINALAPLGIFRLENFLMIIIMAFFMLFFWPISVFNYFWLEKMAYLIHTQSHSYYVWQGFGPYALGLVVIINILWLYILACLTVYFWQKKKKQIKASN